MERCILYVSRQSPHTADSPAIVEEIVRQARLHNVRVGITGALVATQGHFAQLMEGPSDAVTALMEKVESDDRHFDLTMLRSETILRRRLPDWSMAYSGPSTYVARQIMPLMGVAIEADPVRIERLINVLIGLAGPQTMPS